MGIFVFLSGDCACRVVAGKIFVSVWSGKPRILKFLLAL